MPTKRDSTMSNRPIPFAPPSSLSLANMSAGEYRTPSMATGSPFSKSTSMYVGASGAFSGLTERVNMSSEYSTHGSSNALPSYEMCNRLASVEYGAS